MANWGQGAMGAATGFATGGPVGAAIGGITGLLGLGQPHEDPTMRAMRQQQQQISGQLLNYANSAPGSSPDELANMSQARGLLGQQQRATQQRTFANYNPSQGLPASQMLASLGNAFTAQQMAQQSSFLQDASANRRNALTQAAGIGMNAASLYRQQPSAFGQVAGPLAQALAYQQAKRQNGGGGGDDSDVNMLNQQAGGQLQNWYNPSSGDPGAPAPAGFDQSAFGQPGGGQMNPGLMAALQQMGWNGPGMFHSITPGAPGNSGNLTVPMGNVGMGPDATTQAVAGQAGLNAPGNEPGGMNGLNNQMRQSSGASNNSVSAMLRKVLLPGGISLHF